MVCDRPEKITLQDGRLHDENAPAVRFRDGWGVWAINGISVSEQIVMHPETQTLKEIDAETNADVQAIRIERFGWSRYLEESGCQVIHQRIHPRDELPEKLYKDNKGRCRFVVIDPSTSKPVTMLVPRECLTCEAAQAYISFGFDARALFRT